jgi:hypothetical protein
MENRKALLIIGSPKFANSASENLGNLLLSGLVSQGFKRQVEHVGKVLRNGNTAKLFEAMNSANVVIVSSPLYVDSLPAPLISILEQYMGIPGTGAGLVGVINSGFPEPSQSRYALETLRFFANRNGFRWLGGFAIGCGGMFGGKKDLLKFKPAQHVVTAFRQAVVHLSGGEAIPDDTLALASKEIMPKDVYTMMGNMGWYSMAIKYRTLFRLRAKPLETKRRIR